MTMQRIHGACPHDCPDTCGIITEVEDGRAVNFYADPEHPITEGWLCAKVRPYLERVYHPDRLQYPLRRVGPKGSGQWARITWAEAISEIASRWQEIIAQYGAAAILPYSYSGTLGLVQMTVTSSRLWNRLGASQLQRSICGAAAEYAVEATLGARHSQPYEDVAHSKLVIIWGHNPVSTAPHFMPQLKNAQRNGCRVVVIDPRRTRTARGADWHLAPLPNTDGVLALGLAHVIVAENLHNEAWLENYTVGWPQLRERLATYEPARVAAITGLPEQDIVNLARLYATTQPALIKFADGLQRHQHGGQTVRALLALPALTGQYGVRGGGVAYSTSGYFKWAGVSPEGNCPPPARSVNMNRLGAALTGEVTDPPIMSLYVFGSNPAAIAPNAGKIVEGLQREDLFTVVHELFMTDTADYADIVLPATSQLEHADLHKAYGHTMLTYNHPAIPPLGESKSNWEVMNLLAAALGFKEPWLHQSVDEVIEEILMASAQHNPAFRGITLAQLKQGRPVPLALDSATPFADLRFPTSSGKVELFSQRLAEAGHDPLPGWTDPQEVVSYDSASPPRLLAHFASPLTLISGAAHHFVTSSMANQPSLLEREGTPFVEINPADAAIRSITDGDTVVVENERGWCTLRAVVTEAVRPGVLASPKGRWSKLDGGRNVNWTTPDALADLAGQSTFHSNRVWIRKAEDRRWRM
ncbi:MAG: molybdopterin oxidoreductase family protein [Anaerolineae bacterium]|nr:molybdopterin oxidoreductase family protein [Anaerolineales bacterium]MCQ3979498.1 molybdopterin oxidoreductase family protein [Anaerolineae bacterium]